MNLKEKLDRAEHFTTHSITRDELVKFVFDINENIKKEELSKQLSSTDFLAFLNGASYIVSNLAQRFDLDN